MKFTFFELNYVFFKKKINVINNSGPDKLQNTPLLIAPACGMTIVTANTSISAELLKALITDHRLTKSRLLLT